MIDLSRAIIAASQMSPRSARRVLMFICDAGMTTAETVDQPTPGQIHFAKREKFIRRMQGACDRVIEYARHETLRNVERHFHAMAISSAEGDPPKTLSTRLAFDKKSFAEELLAALREEGAAALAVAGQQLFDEVGRDSVWSVPSEAATGFLDTRANLLANTADEVHAEVMDTIQQGLEHGESRKELMSRINTAMDGIKTNRAETIANTETAAAFNFARDKAMREAGVTHKKWLHSQSPDIQEPRPTHVEADGQVQPIDEPFDIGGVSMMHPGDESAGPEEVINCHCVAIPVEAPIQSGESEGHPFRGNQYTLVEHPLDKIYTNLLGRGISVGPNLYELKESQITVTLRQKLNFHGRPLETDSFSLRPKADVTGNPYDRGWILKDKRPDFLRRFGQSP